MPPVSAKFALRWALLGLAVAGCTTTDPLAAGDDEVAATVERFGRVEVTLEAAAGPRPDEAPAPVTITAVARFVEIHADETGRMVERLGLDAQPWAEPPLGHCAPLRAEDPVLDEDDSAAFDGEVVFVDAGAVAVRAADAEFDVPVRLVPDLLPFVSGVEYVLADGVVTTGSETIRVAVEVDGGADPVLGFDADLVVEPVEELSGQIEADGGLWLGWTRASASTEPVHLEIGTVAGGRGRISCTVADAGEAFVDRRALGDLAGAETLEVVVVRRSRTLVDRPGLPVELVAVARTRVLVTGDES